MMRMIGMIAPGWWCIEMGSNGEVTLKVEYQGKKN
jgi:hypothetical protein